MTDTNLYISLARDYGTPLYVYREDIMQRQYKSLESALRAFDASICFAVKANSNLSIISTFGKLGSGFDVVSEGEIRRVLQAGCDPRKIVYSGVGKKSEEIEFALNKGIRMINAESVAELRIIAETAKNLGKTAPIALRVNPDISVETHPYLATGIKSSKFGMAEDDIPAAWDIIRNNSSLSLVGLDCHIGSQITDVAPLRAAYEKLLRLADSLKSQGAPITTLDFGGGLGAPFSGHYKPLDLEAFSQMLKEVLGNEKYSLVFEPGKFLMAEAGLLITQVLYDKNNGPNEFVVVDAGMNDLIRPSLYDAFHQIDLLLPSGEKRDDVEVDIVGPVCETGCYLARKRKIKSPRPGEYLLVRDAGAYGMAMASSYNSRRLPAEVMIKTDGTCELIRKRDSFEDLWKNEAI